MTKTPKETREDADALWEDIQELRKDPKNNMRAWGLTVAWGNMNFRLNQRGL